MEQEIKEYLQQGEILLDNNRYAQAIEYANKVLEIDEMNFRAYVLKGAAFASGQDYDNGEECFKRALLIDKKSGEAHYHMGSVQLLKGNTEQAIEEYQNAINYNYDYPEVYFNMGLAYEERENYEMAVQEYTKAIRKDGLNPLFYIRKVQIYVMQTKYQEALQVLEELRKRCPDSFEGYQYAAQIYTVIGEFDKADALLKQAEEEFSEDEDILLERLKILISKGDIENAILEVEKAEKLIEDEIRQKNLELNKAKLYGMQNQMDKCVEEMEHALTIGEDAELDAELHYLLVNAYQLQKNFEGMQKHAEALDNYNVLNPYAMGAKYFQAMAVTEIDASNKETVYKEAIRYYRNLALERPEHVESYIFRAMCHKEIGQLDKALETIEYVMLLQTTGKLWCIKANILKEMGRMEEAEKALKKAEEAGEDMTLWKEQ